MFKMKGRFMAGLLCAILAAALIVPVSAHGCHGGRGRRGGCGQPVQTTITVCPYTDCSVSGRHYHDRLLYCGYSHESGVCDNNCRALCPYEDCAEAGRHLHGGVAYCGYGHEAGYCDGACRALCPLEDCGLTGRHTHGYTTYCGSDHDCGYCDNSCAVTGHHGGC